MKDTESEPKADAQVEGPKRTLVSVDEPTAIMIQPDDICVLIRPNGDTTHYIPADEEEGLTLGHAVGMSSTIETFGGGLDLLLRRGYEMLEEEEAEN